MNIVFIGWCYEPPSHDKIWGVIKLDGELVTFWGRRDRKLTFKKPTEDVQKMIAKKRVKYRETSFDVLVQNDPDFQDRFEEEIILCKMGDFFHKKPSE